MTKPVHLGLDRYGDGGECPGQSNYGERMCHKPSTRFIFSLILIDFDVWMMHTLCQAPPSSFSVGYKLFTMTARARPKRSRAGE